ncbi:MAG: hypothetical protein AAFU67_15755, partial [Bacteroidota bacterium]
SLIGEMNDAYKEGIGLSNIRRQLQLIYPNQHHLAAEDQPGYFAVSLTLNITHEQNSLLTH